MKRKISLAVCVIIALSANSPVWARGGGGGGSAMGGSPSGFSSGSPAAGSHMSSEAQINSNGRFSEDRSIGLDRADERASDRASAGLSKARSGERKASETPAGASRPKIN